ncbi:hypothetical protein J7M22_02615 [Candidatus Poribacteria bacterium]|nr:hypothetical protein [Candidatus Poribacteria bacterium]
MVVQTTVELTLNSRCSSGRGHWGVFDESKQLDSHQIDLVKKATQIPRFTNRRLFLDFSSDPILIAVEPGVTGIEEDWLHVESGMQQQAIYLACAALGIGTCIHNVGIDGALIGNMHATARMVIKPIHPPYSGSYWTSSRPRPWLGGNLSDPDLRGKMPFFEAIERASTVSEGIKSGLREISQLLWAARGRTPHEYRGRKWGMTIPTWAGGQNYTSVHLLSGNGLYEYINWRGNAPVHRIERLRNVDIQSISPGCTNCIILSTNERTKRALWEIGYMLENIILQATALGVKYEVKMLGHEEKRRLIPLGLSSAVMAVRLF